MSLNFLPPNVWEAVLDQLAESVLITDSKGRILYVNEAFEHLTGYRREEVLGKNPRFLKSGYHTKDFYRQFWKQVLAGMPYRGYFVNRRKDGSLYTEEKIVTPVRNSSGEVAYLVATSRDVTEEMAFRAKLEHLATYDPLTQLLNRRAFIEKVEGELISVNEGRALAYIDLDRFKMVNDLLGHQVGDSILAELGRRLQAALPQAIVGRMGGDEFAAWYPAAAESEAKAKGKFLLDAINMEIHVQGQPVHLEGSMGVALFPDHGATLTELLRRADLAMYRAKLFRLPEPEVFTPDLEGLTPKALSYEAALHRALAAGDAQLVFQSLLDLKEETLTHAEALFRIPSPEGLINPLVHLDLSRRSVNEALDRFVINQARSLQGKYPQLTLWLNITPWSLSDPAFLALLYQEVERGLQTDRVILEISEQLVQPQLSRIAPALWRLRNLGIRLALDDFGAGQISLTYLKSLPINFLKISREFFWAHRGSNRTPAPVLRHIVEMAHELGLSVVLEGVETEEDLNLARALDVDLVQGYFVHTPDTSPRVGLNQGGQPV